MTKYHHVFKQCTFARFPGSHAPAMRDARTSDTALQRTALKPEKVETLHATSLLYVIDPDSAETLE